MIVEPLQMVTFDFANKMSNTLFFNRDAKLVAKTFIQFPGIVQVGMFGAIAQYNFGYNIHLALVVSDSEVFMKYVDLVREYQERTAHTRNERQVRLAAFDVLWGRHKPTWHNSLTDRKLNLRESLDLVVLPFNWQNRIGELEPMLGAASPAPLSKVLTFLTFIETQV